MLQFRKQIRQLNLPQAIHPIYLHHEWAWPITGLGKREDSCLSTGMNPNLWLVWQATGCHWRSTHVGWRGPELWPASSHHCTGWGFQLLPPTRLMEHSDFQVTAVPKGEMTCITTHSHSSGAAWGKLAKFCAMSLDTSRAPWTEAI